MEKFLSCDWGTSSFRLRLADALSGEVFDEVRSGQGIAETYKDWQTANRPKSERAAFYKAVLSDAIRKMKKVPEGAMPVILSGMASSSVGIEELPYRSFPFTWDSLEFPVKKFDADECLKYPLYLISGFRTQTDIMRGEETMLLGCEINQETENILIFPGTHAKHVYVKNGVAFDFRTYTTGEIFNLLLQKSILSNSVMKGEDTASFILGVRDARNSNLLHKLFMVRTRHVLDNFPPISNYQYLSGLLIGTELKELGDTTASIVVVSEEPLASAYLRALNFLNPNVKIKTLNARDALINGHCRIAMQFLQTS